jgi:hypothetical protein
MSPIELPSWPSWMVLVVDLPKRSVHTSYPGWRLEERIGVTKGNRTEAVDWASLGDTHNVTRERRWWSLPLQLLGVGSISREAVTHTAPSKPHPDWR